MSVYRRWRITALYLYKTVETLTERERENEDGTSFPTWTVTRSLASLLGDSSVRESGPTSRQERKATFDTANHLRLHRSLRDGALSSEPDQTRRRGKLTKVWRLRVSVVD